MSRRRATTTLLLASACAAPPSLPPPAAATEVSVDAVVVTEAAGQVLEVRVTAPSSRRVSLQDPVSEPLAFQRLGERVERLGDTSLTTRRYKVEGPPSSYVLDKICAEVEGQPERPTCAPRLYLDIGVQPDRTGMADIVEPGPTSPRVPWEIAAAVVVIGGAAVGLGALAWRRRPVPLLAPVAEEPPDVLAIRRWEGVRDDRLLTDHERALALSEIFRAYLESTLDFPARSWTSTETLAHLERLDALPRINLPRAKRLLRATDRVKYAEARPGESFFVDLEGDLRAFIEQTRPKRWNPEATS